MLLTTTAESPRRAVVQRPTSALGSCVDGSGLARTPASAGCRATTTAAPPGSASVFKPSSTAGAHPSMTEFRALSHAESARHIAQTPAILNPQILRLACRWRGLWLIHGRRNCRDRHNRIWNSRSGALGRSNRVRVPPLASGSRSWCRVMLPSGARSATQCCIAERLCVLIHWPCCRDGGPEAAERCATVPLTNPRSCRRPLFAYLA